MIAIFALALVALVSMVALILEGGNAYAQQRVVQNAADASANAGAVVLSQNLAGVTKSDADVAAAVNAVAGANHLDSQTGHYTNVSGAFLSSGGAVVGTSASAATVGGGVIPPGAQGVHLGGKRSFATAFAKVIGINSFDASADATAVTGRLTGGAFLPVVFPINIVDCDKSGDLGTGEVFWELSQPDGPDAGLEPDGQEYIVPLCKTASGSFQILDLDPDLKCGEEAAQGVTVSWPTLPVDVPSDNGNNCAKPIADEVNANLQGHTVLIPICEVDCVTTGGSKAVYTIVKVAAFYIDYMSDQNGGKNTACDGNGGSLKTIAGNGSSSCLAGWFVRWITAGPVGAGAVGNSDAIGIQLIK
jgi:Flp pilus assembly protein TadG